MVVNSLDEQCSPVHVPCQVFDGLPIGDVGGLSRMNVETGVVVPRHQQFNLVRVKVFLFLQRSQKPEVEAHGNIGRGTPFQLMKWSYPNEDPTAQGHKHADGS